MLHHASLPQPPDPIPLFPASPEPLHLTLLLSTSVYNVTGLEKAVEASGSEFKS